MAMVFGGSIRFSTAAFRSGEYPTSSSYPAHLRNRGKVERRTTTLTQGGPWVITGTMPPGRLLCNHLSVKDGAAFAAYIEKVLVRELPPGTVVNLDNLGTHKNAEAEKTMRKAE
jgi:hypothetical protein